MLPEGNKGTTSETKLVDNKQMRQGAVRVICEHPRIQPTLQLKFDKKISHMTHQKVFLSFSDFFPCFSNDRFFFPFFPPQVRLTVLCFCVLSTGPGVEHTALRGAHGGSWDKNNTTEQRKRERDKEANCCWGQKQKMHWAQYEK